MNKPPSWQELESGFRMQKYASLITGVMLGGLELFDPSTSKIHEINVKVSIGLLAMSGLASIAQYVAHEKILRNERRNLNAKNDP